MYMLLCNLMYGTNVSISDLLIIAFYHAMVHHRKQIHFWFMSITNQGS